MWERLKAFFKHSETIVLARLQYVAGIVFLVLTTLDPHLLATYMPTKYVPLWLIFIGVLTEIARRHRMKDEK